MFSSQQSSATLLWRSIIATAVCQNGRFLAKHSIGSIPAGQVVLLHVGVTGNAFLHAGQVFQVLQVTINFLLRWPQSVLSLLIKMFPNKLTIEWIRKMRLFKMQTWVEIRPGRMQYFMRPRNSEAIKLLHKSFTDRQLDRANGKGLLWGRKNPCTARKYSLLPRLFWC